MDNASITQFQDMTYDTRSVCHRVLVNYNTLNSELQLPVTAQILWDFSIREQPDTLHFITWR